MDNPALRSWHLVKYYNKTKTSYPYCDSDQSKNATVCFLCQSLPLSQVLWKLHDHTVSSNPAHRQTDMTDRQTHWHWQTERHTERQATNTSPPWWRHSGQRLVINWAVAITISRILIYFLRRRPQTFCNWWWVCVYGCKLFWRYGWEWNGWELNGSVNFRTHLYLLQVATEARTLQKLYAIITEWELHQEWEIRWQTCAAAVTASRGRCLGLESATLTPARQSVSAPSLQQNYAYTQHHYSLLAYSQTPYVCQCQCQCQSWIYIAHKRKASNALVR